MRCAKYIVDISETNYKHPTVDFDTYIMCSTNQNLLSTLHAEIRAYFTLIPPQHIVNNCPWGAMSNGKLMTAEWKGTSWNLISYIDCRILKGHLEVLITAASQSCHFITFWIRFKGGHQHTIRSFWSLGKWMKWKRFLLMLFNQD